MSSPAGLALQPGEHIPVLIAPIVEILQAQNPRLVVDLTFGLGGYAQAVTRALPHCRYLGFDRDAEAVAKGQLRFAGQTHIKIQQADFLNWWQFLPADEKADAILMDLGISSTQLDDGTRGFSFQVDGPLDMRMNQQGEATAAQWLQNQSTESLADALFNFGDVRQARPLSRRIVERLPIESTGALKSAVLSVLPRLDFHKRQRILSQVFQAIRIGVNQEWEQLQKGLTLAWENLNIGGQLAVVTFHSGEDKIVKTFGRSVACEALKLIKPDPTETAQNPRSRSAKLRVLKKSVSMLDYRRATA